MANANTPRAYRGKYPHRIKAVVSHSSDKGMVRIESNDGQTFGFITAKAATWAHGQARMPKLGEDAREWNTVQDAYDALVANVRLGLKWGIEGALSQPSPMFQDTDPSGKVTACFVACAITLGREAATQNKPGNPFKTADGAFKASGLEFCRDMFVAGFLMHMREVYPSGVPVCRDSGFVLVDGVKHVNAVRVVGVGLIA